MLLNFKPKRFTCYIDYFLLKLLLELISFFWPDVRYPFVAKMVVFTDIPFFWGGGLLSINRVLFHMLQNVLTNRHSAVCTSAKTFRKK